MADRDALVIIFARAPIPGRAKTRLIPALGEEGAAFLHAGLVEKTLDTVVGLADEVAIQLWHDGDSQDPFFARLAQRYPLTCHRQAEGDLGTRMYHALHCGSAEYARVLLIGTDCPALQASDLSSAIQALEDGNDWVLGPAGDGGYYLIGATHPDTPVFEGIAWGGAGVMRQTRERLAAMAKQWHELGVRHDVDEAEDLLVFAEYQNTLERGKSLVELAG